MKRVLHRIGLVVFVLGILMLVCGLILALTTIGAVVGPYLITVSILVNTAGIMLLNAGRRK